VDFFLAFTFGYSRAIAGSRRWQVLQLDLLQELLGALGSHITKKIIGSGMMKGRGVKDVAKKVAQVIGKNKDKILR
jgi:hypothetical protein